MYPTSNPWKRARLTGCAAALWLCGPLLATAETLSYSISMSESLAVLQNPNNEAVANMAAWAPQHTLMLQRTMPYIELRNTSQEADIMQFTMSIGEASKNFDWATLIEASPGVSFSLVSPDTVMGNLRADVLTIDFTGFTSGSFVRFRTGLSPDNQNASPIVDYRNTFFRMNGTDASENSVLGVTYATADGDVIGSDVLPNFENLMPTTSSLAFGGNYGMDSVMAFTTEFSVDDPTPPTPIVPEPASVLLLATGLLGLLGWRLRSPRRKGTGC